jgi:shikimate dehydrogenase
MEFGLIGFPLSHSFSKKYFTEKFERENLHHCTYHNFPIEDITALPALIARHPTLKGFNVTIPYKEQVLPFLHQQSTAVQAIKACNCIRIEEGNWVGYNTDVIGFEQSLKKKLAPHHQQALILGTGGAAKAVAWVLEKLKINYLLVSRTAMPNRKYITYHQLTPPVLAAHLLIVNTSPLGMYPAIETAPNIPYQLLTQKHYLYDLVYNPEETLFLKQGKQQGAIVENGADMLMIQAEESWKIWNGGNT